MDNTKHKYPDSFKYVGGVDQKQIYLILHKETFKMLHVHPMTALQVMDTITADFQCQPALTCGNQP